MIVRIVKMTFKENAINQFLAIITTANHKIRQSPGCIGLEVIQDINTPHVFFTYSKWESESDLNNYRQSELFKEVWPVTKSLFAAKPETWTLKELKF